MRSLVLFFRYLFSPNPAALAHYFDPGILALFALCGALIVGSFLITRWRRGLQAHSKKLTRHWSMVSFWMGMIGLLLILSRVERIQILAMPFLWVLWEIALVGFVFIQFRLFRAKNYEVVPMSAALPTDPYLPGKKKK